VNRSVASRDSITGAVSGDVYARDYKDFRDNIFKVDASSLSVEVDAGDVVRPRNFAPFAMGRCAASGGLMKKGARDLVRHLLGSSIQSLLDRGAKQEHMQALQTSFWTDLALVYLERKRPQIRSVFKTSLNCFGIR
jgi:hypothetical protein